MVNEICGLPECTRQNPQTARGAAAKRAAAFRVTARIGSGGAGDVYEAVQITTGDRVALKFPKRTGSWGGNHGRQLEREAAVLAGLRSRHVVEFKGLAMKSDGTCGIVMERLVGLDLASQLRRTHRLAVPRAVQLIHDACAGVRAVHAAGLIHRDIKPANLFIAHQSEQEMCKIIDFGTAQRVHGTGSTRSWTSGTPRYMAPEQLAGEVGLDAGVDVYALASVLYQCIAGEAPHDADTLERMIFARLHSEPRALQGDDVPVSLAAAISKALARDPSKRFSCVDEFAASIERHGLGRTCHDRLALPSRGQPRFLGYCTFGPSLEPLRAVGVRADFGTAGEATR